MRVRYNGGIAGSVEERINRDTPLRPHRAVDTVRLSLPSPVLPKGEQLAARSKPNENRYMAKEYSRPEDLICRMSKRSKAYVRTYTSRYSWTSRSSLYTPAYPATGSTVLVRVFCGSRIVRMREW